MKQSIQKNLEKQKEEIVKLLEESNDPILLKRVKGVLLEEEIDWWDELTDEQKIDLKESIAQAEKGETLVHEDVMKKYKKWLPK